MRLGFQWNTGRVPRSVFMMRKRCSICHNARSCWSISSALSLVQEVQTLCSPSNRASLASWFFIWMSRLPFPRTWKVLVAIRWCAFSNAFSRCFWARSASSGEYRKINRRYPHWYSVIWRPSSYSFIHWCVPVTTAVCFWFHPRKRAATMSTP